jgi:membrane protein implicated in regulation of membrane protease activity
VLAWLALIVVLPVLVARLATARYFMPVAAPLALILAGTIGGLWDLPHGRVAARAVIVAGLGAWLIFFAGPFLRTDLTDPGDLPLHGTNWTEYISGYLSADDAVRQAADHVNALGVPPEQPIYANWNLCHLLFLYARHPVECLELNQVKSSLVAHLNADVAPGQAALVLLRGYSPFLDSISGICYGELARFESTLIDRPVTIWQVRRAPC